MKLTYSDTRKFSLAFAALALAIAAPAALASAQAATTPAVSTSAAAAPANPTGVSKLAIINIQGAIIATNEGKRDFDTLNKKFDPRQAELKAQTDEIDRLKKDLSAQGDKLSEAERATRVQAIETKQKSLQRSFEDAQNDYQAQSNEVAQRIGQKLMEVMDKYAKQNGIGVVIDVSSQSNNVLWGSADANITEAVVNMYNSQSGITAPAPSAPRPSSGVRTTPKPAVSSTAPKK